MDKRLNPFELASVRLANILENAGIVSTDQFARTDPLSFLAMRNAGIGAILEFADIKHRCWPYCFPAPGQTEAVLLALPPPTRTQTKALLDRRKRMGKLDYSLAGH
jgi:hypothetical protein